ncbi:MAG: BON domain-containing protein, partial [Planctomycetales bacterium]|nr:BON domain-containing protein [Planctomycetales bacterium]
MRFAAILLCATMVLVATSAPVRADDEQIAQEISTKLQQRKTADQIQDFRISVKVEDGTVWMSGQVASDAHRDLALDVARRVAGVQLVVNDLEVQGAEADPASASTAAASWNSYEAVGTSVSRGPKPSSLAAPTGTIHSSPTPLATSQAAPMPVPVPMPVRQVSNNVPLMAPGPQTIPVRAGMPTPAPTPVPYQIAQMTGAAPMAGGRPEYRVAQGCGPGGCAPSYGGNVEYGGVEYGGAEYGGAEYGGEYGGQYGGFAHEEPNLPGYAWPGYAAYPNYAALTYPKQYSPKAWPYIGPFYPYP